MHTLHSIDEWTGGRYFSISGLGCRGLLSAYKMMYYFKNAEKYKNYIYLEIEDPLKFLDLPLGAFMCVLIVNH